MWTTNGQFSQGALGEFLTLPGEVLLVAQRKHWFVLFLPLLSTILFGLFFLLVLVLTFTAFIPSLTLVIASTLLLFVVLLNLATKRIIEWYFHLYVVTTRKILEVCYTPLSSRIVNDVLLDQVRCTEIDAKTHGIVNEFIDMGNVIVTFDRPTHQEEFVFTNIKNPKTLGIYLGDILESMGYDGAAPMWYRSKENPKDFRFTETIFPKQSIQVV